MSQRPAGLRRGEFKRRLDNRFRDYQLYSLERHRRMSRSGARELVRNVSLAFGATSVFREPIQFRYKGFTIPCDLAEMTGSGHEGWNEVIAEHLECYRLWMPIEAESHVLEIGCGIGRDAMAFTDLLSSGGSYVGVDVTRPSIEWCRAEITSRFPNFDFLHLDVKSDMYNPQGLLRADSMTLRIGNGSVDRVVLHSVFTHMFLEPIAHYLREIRRCLTDSGLVMASFFIVDDDSSSDAVTASPSGVLQFRHHHPEATRINDRAHPEAAVAFSLDRVAQLARDAHLRIIDVHPGRWKDPSSGAPNGQDLVILGPSI
ncbi:MAG: class I SAM-dependent methyltransferase [Acidimicrobiales bacterium]